MFGRTTYYSRDSRFPEVFFIFEKYPIRDDTMKDVKRIMKNLVRYEYFNTQAMRPDPIEGFDIRCEDGPDQPCWFYIFRHW